MNNDIIDALPSPKELVEQIKEENVAISLRMKPGTKQYFDQLAAQDKSLSVNNLINRLLDSYMAHYTNPTMRRSTTEKLYDYLKDVSKRLCSLDDDIMLARIYNFPKLIIVGSDGKKLDYPQAELELESAQTGNPAAFVSARVDLTIYIDNKDFIEIACTNNLPNGLRASYNQIPNHTKNDDGYDIREVNINPQDWIVVVALTNAYLGKARELSPNSPIIINRSLAKNLAEAVNISHDREDLARNLTSFFVDFFQKTAAGQ